MESAERAQTEHHISAHRRSSNHRNELLASEFCGCFHCCEVYSPMAIDEWVDENDKGQGQTAMCPSCGIDSVISVDRDSPEVRAFLKMMRQYWF